MTELTSNNKGLTINLPSVASEYNQNNNSGSKSSRYKSPKSFKESNGAVGLGIVAALNESDPTNYNKSGRGPILSVSPRSNPIPVLSPNFAKSAPNSSSSDESEEYTCVISHIGKNVIKKREYFDGDSVNGSEKTSLMVGTGVISAPFSPSAAADAPVMETEADSEFEPADFLSSCYLCEKLLHGLDIFMYRGEKAFCSAECRHKQISSDERREKRGSGVNNKSIKYSVSPCSDQLQFFAGVAAA